MKKPNQLMVAYAQQNQTYLGDYLHEMREMRRASEENQERKNQNPEKWKIEIEDMISFLLAGINRALDDLLQEADFRRYLHTKLQDRTEALGKSQLIIPLVDSSKPDHTGTRLALVASSEEALLIQVCQVDSTGNVTLIDYVDDNDFMYTLRSAQECTFLVSLIVDTFGEP